MRTLNNQVLIKPNRKEHEVKIKGKLGKEQVLELDTSFNEMEHTVIVGNIVALPDELVYDRRNPASLHHLTTKELKVGDLVTYYYISARNAVSQGKMFIEDGELYIYIPYDQIFAARRGEEVVIPNGYAIIEPEEDTINTTLILPDQLKGKKSENIGIIRYLGTPNMQHKHEPTIGGDDPLLKVGDKVLLDRVCNIPLEYPLHKEFDKDKEYYRVERRNIIAVVN